MRISGGVGVCVGWNFFHPLEIFTNGEFVWYSEQMTIYDMYVCRYVYPLVFTDLMQENK